MTREELLTAAREAKAWRRDVAGEGDWPWLTEDELANDYGLPEPDALYVSLASPDTVLEMQAEIDELRAALERVAVMARDQRYLRRDVRETVDAALGARQSD